MVEYSTKSFIHTEFRSSLFLHLFTELFPVVQTQLGCSTIHIPNIHSGARRRDGVGSEAITSPGSVSNIFSAGILNKLINLPKDRRHME